MVELLAVVAILGVLSAIAIVSVGAILSKADENYYKTQLKNMVIAAKSYTHDNRNALPKKTGDTRNIKLQELQRRKYIGDILDRSKKKCEEGSVNVFKYDKNEYNYSAYLKCGNKVYGIDPTNGIPGPEVILEAKGNYKNPYFTYEINGVDPEGNSNGKIISYNYQIYSSSVLIKDSGSISVSKATSIKNKKISLKDYVPGNFMIVFTAVNEYGGTTKIKIENSYQDPDGPICGPQTPERTSWDNTSEVTISILCYPRADGSACAREVFTEHFSAEAEKNFITIVNEKGHKTKCDVNTYIDRTLPTKPIVVSTDGFPEGTWKNENFTLTVTSEDNHSGIAYYQYCYPGADGICEESEWVTYERSVRGEEEFATGAFEYVTTAFSIERSEKVSIRAVDRAGNKSEETLYQINIDKTAPVVSNVNFDTTTRKLNAVMSDNLSKISSYGLTTTTLKPQNYTDVTDIATYNLSYSVEAAFSGTYYIWAKDAAGNINDGTVSNVSITPYSYAITFDANGGSGAPAAQSKIHGVTLQLSNTIPTRSGYTFLGWSTSSTATSPTYAAGGNYTANAVAKLYAVWIMDNPLKSYKCANKTVGSAPYVLEYTGNCTAIDDGSGNWRFKFLSSGKLKTSVNYLLDAFLVGGGGGGGKVTDYYGGGGGGGYTTTSFIKMKKNTEYTITIGAGGTYETAGGATSAFGITAAGGSGAVNKAGGAGGSGGAFAVSGKGGSDGANGGGCGSGSCGIGQGNTTREFGESTGQLYAGGGGSGYNNSNGGAGGAGGGGAGGHNKKGINGTANTGGGGGGGGHSGYAGGTGGSGIVIIRNTRSSDTSKLPGTEFDFTYTGSYSVIDDGNGNWRIKFLTSGTFKSSKDLLVDTFLVGGGGGGGKVTDYYGAGGGGGYTTTSFAKIKKDVAYSIVIGAGGAVEQSGGRTSGFGASAAGGQGAVNKTGGTGGSGGAFAVSGKGGSNGSNGGGGNGYGLGQGTTTREFGESTGKLYAGGGGSGYNTNSSGLGGSGGGGHGGHNAEGSNGAANTGGGGGGGGHSGYSGGKGGSGIVIIRNTRSTSTSNFPGVGFDFTYTGTYAIIDEGSGNWKIKFLTSGDFKSNSDVLVDAFLVGGGGGGGQVSDYYGGGGGGGYTTTSFAKIKAGVTYPIVIGAGGGNETNGSASTGFGSIAAGGQRAINKTGGTGGSGGAFAVSGKGGSNGGIGGGGGGQGAGQGTTTREFGESTGKLYAGGGGSGYNDSGAGNGGSGGGGNGGHNSVGASGIANTGGGGGGGGHSGYAGGAGGSGIVIIRNTRSGSTANFPGVGFDFSYTGSYAIVDEGSGNWKIKFLTNGDFKSNSDLLVDTFLVGGGGGGGQVNDYYGGGGAGGYTQTSFVKIKRNVTYPIVIGSGGGTEGAGGTSTGFGSRAEGGQGAVNKTGGTGGSGGAFAVSGKGGSNGANGGGGEGGQGVGQTITTREFGESSGQIYSGGGGSGYNNGGNGNGGTGGGGNGGHESNGSSGATNTGGGGGGGGHSGYAGGSGGSGIVMIRNTRGGATERLPGVAFDFTYTGSYAIVNEGSGNWKIKFLTSGDFKSNSDLLVDTFLVGGGGGGGKVTDYYGGGGGGGYTQMSFAKIKAGVTYPVVVGAGGGVEASGGTSTGFGSRAVGGQGAQDKTGGSGGSGGAFAVSGKGGSNGANGGGGDGGQGMGQGITTGEFRNASGQLYSGGGGSGYSSSSTVGKGGNGGGGNGGHNSEGSAAIVNTGSGGGGGGHSGYNGGKGASGIVIIRNTRSSSTANLPGVGFDFTYTGSYSVIDDGSNHWRIKFLTSGTFRTNKDIASNVFLVGGGGGGGQVTDYYGGGGGGGYTKTANISINKNTDYAIVVGAGGASEVDGSASTGFGLTAAGGKRASNKNGGAGGSGGAFAVSGKGGSNGNKGGGSSDFGTGQGTTTREFGETSGQLYSGGGGSGYNSGGGGAGGAGGGSNGGHNAKASSAIVNTGGGGGGGGHSGYAGGTGGSGIVIIRDAR